MKKYTRLAVALMAGCCMLQAGQALAGAYTEYFADTVNSSTYFPTFQDTSYSTIESIGNNPDITGILVSYDNITGLLLNIAILSNSAFDTNNGWGFTSLFINNNGAGQDWDYLVHAGGTTNSEFVDGGASLLPGDGLYSVINPNDYDYTYVGDPQNGFIGREGHPNGIAEGDLTYQGALTPGYSTGYSYASSDGEYSGTSAYALIYDFSSFSIILGSEYTIGWTPFCANDVVYEEGKWSGPLAGVPEPVTMVLFGAGMAALAGWRSRKKNTEK